MCVVTLCVAVFCKESVKTGIFQNTHMGEAVNSFTYLHHDVTISTIERRLDYHTISAGNEGRGIRRYSNSFIGVRRYTLFRSIVQYYKSRSNTVVLVGHMTVTMLLVGVSKLHL